MGAYCTANGVDNKFPAAIGFSNQVSQFVSTFQIVSVTDTDSLGGQIPAPFTHDFYHPPENSIFAPHFLKGNKFTVPNLQNGLNI